MSDAARKVVSAIPHQKLKGSKRALLEQVAELIAEGQRMTRPIADWELAKLVGVDERTIRRCRRVLVEDRVIRVVGGSQGRPASYEFLDLPSAGADPSLPLIGEVPRPRPPSEERPTPLLESLTERPYQDRPIRVYTVGSFVRSWVTNFGSFVRSWVTNFGSFVRSGRSAVDVGVTRARDVKDLRSTHTHTGAPIEPATAEDLTPAPFRHPKHAHCGVKFCVPDFLEEQFRQQSGWSHEQLLVHYRRWDVQAIEQRTPIPEALKWLRARFADVVSGTPSTTTRGESRSPPRPARKPWQKPDIPVGDTLRPWHCPHDEECASESACIDRQGQRAKKAQSG